MKAAGQVSAHENLTSYHATRHTHAGGFDRLHPRGAQLSLASFSKEGAGGEKFVTQFLFMYVV